MKTEINNAEGIETEVERTSKDDTEARRRTMYMYVHITEDEKLTEIVLVAVALKVV
ncbi:MAG: hypothetical protein K6G45_00005 [Lachnospiraceae bacterium]|nr:hypothetical protein [Lachnospiraceae bacterium]